VLGPDAELHSAYGREVLAGAIDRHLGAERAGSARLALTAMGGCALIALVDPNESGRYPTCPTKALLGMDCPVCGTLRGLHSLSRGRVGQALDHNALLAVAVPFGLFMWGRWVRHALGRPMAPLVLPRWLVPSAVVVGIAFTVVRNLSWPPSAWLGSGA